MFLMVKKHEIDTKFAFVAHLSQLLLPKLFIDGGHIVFGHNDDPEESLGTLTKSLELALFYIRDKFGAFTLITLF